MWYVCIMFWIPQFNWSWGSTPTVSHLCKTLDFLKVLSPLKNYSTGQRISFIQIAHNMSWKWRGHRASSIQLTDLNGLELGLAPGCNILLLMSKSETVCCVIASSVLTILTILRCSCLLGSHLDRTLHMPRRAERIEFLMTSKNVSRVRDNTLISHKKTCIFGKGILCSKGK